MARERLKLCSLCTIMVAGALVRHADRHRKSPGDQLLYVDMFACLHGRFFVALWQSSSLVAH